MKTSKSSNISSKSASENMHYTGRFAPSPTGPLHFGSLIAAVASYLCARQISHNNQGKWLLRIEDVDSQRCQQSHALSIISTLENYGFEWDDEILYQSQRPEAYQAALDSITDKIYPCSCTRKALRENSSSSKYSYTYPGFCREGVRNPASDNRSIRLRTNQNPVCFTDQCQPQPFCQNIETEVGDFIVKRSDEMFAYHLAVVVDDHWQQVNHIVRGSDLFDNTPRQLYLQSLLAYSHPQYLHIPVAVDAQGKKLSKQNLSPEIPMLQRRFTLIKALEFLGQVVPDKSNFSSLDDLWKWAVENWDTKKIPAVMTKQYDDTII
ncbi:MAG: tRNA glutamyl-Q(34) synthetase GluQRS [Cocleimonas sp.]